MELKGTFCLIFLHASVTFIASQLPSIDQEQFNMTGDYCQERWSCASTDSSLRTCKCDIECDVYNDCCHDFEAGKEHKQTREQKAHFLDCIYFPELKSESFIFVIQSCPNDVSNEERESCTNTNNLDITTKTPVYGKNSGYVYKNMYCAMCHKENFNFFTPGVNCEWKYKYEGSYDLSSLLQQENCKFLYKSPDDTIKPRSCYPMTSTCNGTTDDEITCSNGPLHMVFTETEIFRNPQCAACNNVLETDLSCSPSRARFLPKAKRNRFNYSYRILFDLRTNTQNSKSTRRSKVTDEAEGDLAGKCSNGQIYDPFSDVCQDVNCIPPFVYLDSECILKDFSNVTSENYSQHMDCISFKTNLSEIQIINYTKLKVLSSNVEYTKFHLSDLFAYICIIPEHQEVYNSLVLYSKEEGLLSLVSGTLSVIFLSVTFLIYASNSKLHNIPGKNLLCLMISLMTSQVLFIIAPVLSDFPIWCAATASVIHFTFLASFFWMNVMAFDMFFTFSTGFKRSGEKGQSSKRFGYYSLYAWTFPFLIVAIAVGMDQLSSSVYRPHYGRGVCWIANPNALLAFFLVPLAIILFFNMIFFIFTAKSIYISEHNTAKILKRKESCKLFVYLKLSIVMGMTWIFGFVATGANGVVWWYLFIIFNALQGVFIFLSFVFTKKVMTLVRERTRRFYLNTRSMTSLTGRTTSSTKSTHLIVANVHKKHDDESVC